MVQAPNRDRWQAQVDLAVLLSLLVHDLLLTPRIPTNLLQGFLPNSFLCNLCLGTATTSTTHMGNTLHLGTTPCINHTTHMLLTHLHLSLLTLVCLCHPEVSLLHFPLVLLL
jgi:hypothetical protein